MYIVHWLFSLSWFCEPFPTLACATARSHAYRICTNCITNHILTQYYSIYTLATKWSEHTEGLYQPSIQQVLSKTSTNYWTTRNDGTSHTFTIVMILRARSTTSKFISSQILIIIIVRYFIVNVVFRKCWIYFDWFNQHFPQLLFTFQLDEL